MGTFFSNIRKNGIKIKNVNFSMMILCCLLCTFILFLSFNIKSKYKSIIYSINDYADCTKAIENFRDSSDFLSNQARLFVVQQDIAFVNNYFREYSSLQTRENSIEVLEITHDKDVIDIDMQMAYEESKIINKIEFYAMSLVCDALKIPLDQLPQDLQKFISSNNESLYSVSNSHTLFQSSLDNNNDNYSYGQNKILQAQNLLFDSDYQNGKDRINKYISEASNQIAINNVQIQENDRRIFYKNLLFQIVMVIVLLVCSISLFIILFVFVLKPLDYNTNSICNEKKMHVTGAYEMRLIAKTYNALREKDEIRASILKHKAEHDPLTGLINREAFSKIKEVFSDTEEAMAYLIIDIDLFKNINDKYGHLIGDEVLKKIASILSEQFRNTDYVARIGGDEFAVIMTKFGDTPELIIQRKIESINNLLQSKVDGLPCVSLSVGVAISSMGYNSLLESQADKALYRVKQGGRCNCSFYNIEQYQEIAK